MTFSTLASPSVNHLVEQIEHKEAFSGDSKTEKLFIKCFNNSLYSYMRADNYEWSCTAKKFLNSWSDQLERKIATRVNELFSGIPFENRESDNIANVPNVSKLTKTQLRALDFTLREIYTENVSIPAEFSERQFHTLYNELSTLGKLVLCMNRDEKFSHPTEKLEKIVKDSLIFKALPTYEQQYIHYKYQERVTHISLKDMHTESLIYIKDSAITYILECFSNLESLDLTNCSSITNNCLFPYHENLRELTLTGTSILPDKIDTKYFKNLDITVNNRPISVAFLDDILDPIYTLDDLCPNFLKATFFAPFKRMSLELIFNAFKDNPEKHFDLLVHIWKLCINIYEFDTVQFIKIILSLWTNTLFHKQQGHGPDYLLRTYHSSYEEEFPCRLFCHRITDFIIYLLTSTDTPLHIKGLLFESLRSELCFEYPEHYPQINVCLWDDGYDFRESYAIGSKAKNSYIPIASASQHTLTSFYQQERIQYFLNAFPVSILDSSFINGSDGMIEKLCKKVLYLQEELIEKSIYCESATYTISSGVLETAVAILTWMSLHDEIDTNAQKQIATVFKHLLVHPKKLKHTHKEGSAYQVIHSPLFKKINNAVTLQGYISGSSYPAGKEYKCSIPYILASFFVTKIPSHLKNDLHKQLIAEFQGYKEDYTTERILLDELSNKKTYLETFGTKAHSDYHLANILTGTFTDDDIPPHHKNEFLGKHLTEMAEAPLFYLTNEVREMYFHAFCHQHLGIINVQYLEALVWIYYDPRSSNLWKKNIKSSLESFAKARFKIIPFADPTGLTEYVYTPDEIQKKARNLLQSLTEAESNLVDNYDYSNNEELL
ncbi:MAG: hypothetical protein VX777_02365 [Chlamydiota bacterium]|nr:hypothetical protein [Chlamydiota bacterium]